MTSNDDSPPCDKPRRPRWDVLKRFAGGPFIWIFPVAATLILVLGGFAWRHHRVQQRLDEALAELDRTDPGWRLADIEASREQIPEEENSARVVVAAASLLPRNWPLPEFYDRFTELQPEELLSPDDFARLNQELKGVRSALEKARKLARMPRGRYPTDYTQNVTDAVLEDRQRSRQVIHLLVCDARQYEYRHDVKNALSSCQAAFNVARAVGDEPLAISQLVRIAGVMLACKSIERVLAQGQPRTEDMNQTRKLLMDEEAFLDLPIVARGERARYHEFFEAMERGDVSFSEAAGERSHWNEYFFGFLYRDNVRAQHPTMLDLVTRWVVISRLPMPVQSEAERQLDEKALREASDRGDGLAALPLTAMPKMGDASRRKHALLRCTIAALAAECYRQSYQKWPDSLEKLCPQYYAEVPQDPFDGKPLRYRSTEDGVVIYSISTDEVDNYGNLKRKQSNQPGLDLGIRLWDAAKRRQSSKPKKNTP